MNLFVLCYANDNDAFVPELWVREGLAILEENMVMANLVHRDFSMDIANYGDVVNTRRPGSFSAKRKVDADSIVLQDASATLVQVPLNQHIYISFTIKDGEASKSFQDLVEVYLAPAMQGMARSVDRILCGQAHQFLGNKAGKLGGLSSTTAKTYTLEAREKLNTNLAYQSGRNLVLAPSAETALLATDLFIAANQRGDMGTALEEARLGRILGFDTYMAQNQPAALGVVNTKSQTNGASTAYAAGTTGSLTVNINAYEAVAGEFVVFGDNAQPTWATAVTASTDTTAVTLNEALKYAVAANSAIAVYKKADVNGAYAAGYAKAITIDHTSGYRPAVGQLLAFGANTTARQTFTIIDSVAVNATQCTVLLDRPLVSALTDGQDCFPGPAGTYNLAFHRDALAFVSRPLARPNVSMGARSAVASYNDVAMRVTMQYDITTQGTIVTCDLLAGVALLDANLGCVLLG